MLKVKQMQKRIEELRAMVVELDRRIDAALDDGNTAEADRLEVAAKDLVNEESDLQHIMHYARISKQPKNEWFSEFVKSFSHGQYITARQEEIFTQYGKGGKAIVNGTVYTASDNRIYITHLPEIWKEYA